MTNTSAKVDAEHEQLIWTHPGMSTYYRNKQGRVFSAMPWRFVDYWQMTHDPDLEPISTDQSLSIASNDSNTTIEVKTLMDHQGRKTTKYRFRPPMSPRAPIRLEICVLRYALQRNARDKPDEVFAAFEGGERWTFAQTLRAVESLAGNLHALGVRQGDHVVLVLPTSPAGAAGDVRDQLSRRGLCARQSGAEGIVAGACPAQCRRQTGRGPRQRARSRPGRGAPCPRHDRAVVRRGDGMSRRRHHIHGVSALTKPPRRHRSRQGRSGRSIPNPSSIRRARPAARRACCRPICTRFPASVPTPGIA